MQSANTIIRFANTPFICEETNKHVKLLNSKVLIFKAGRMSFPIDCFKEILHVSLCVIYLRLDNLSWCIFAVHLFLYTDYAWSSLTSPGISGLGASLRDEDDIATAS